jgi:hypothetical protein
MCYFEVSRAAWSLNEDLDLDYNAENEPDPVQEEKVRLDLE